LRKLVLGIPAQASGKKLNATANAFGTPIRPRHLVPTQQGVGILSRSCAAESSSLYSLTALAGSITISAAASHGERTRGLVAGTPETA
jgi:hypothetical protein